MNEQLEKIKKRIENSAQRDGYTHILLSDAEKEFLIALLNGAEKKSENISSEKCREIACLFNNICVSLPPIRTMSDTRIKTIKSAAAKIQSSGTTFEEFFKKIEMSDFLTGRKSDWRASFDWILKKSNLIKIIEGNYDNPTNTKHKTQIINGSFDTDEFFAAALSRSNKLMEKLI